MHCGCVLVAFDVLGNREYLYNGWTGRMIPKADLDELWHTIEHLMNNESEKERLRANGQNLIKALFDERGKFEQITEFLNLNGASGDAWGELEHTQGTKHRQSRTITN